MAARVAMTGRRLIAVSWSMPPALFPRSIQISRLLKGLRRLDWHSTVVTAAMSSRGATDPVDPDLEKLYAGQFEVIPVAQPDLAEERARPLRSFDEKISGRIFTDDHLWAERAAAAAKDIKRRERAEVLVTFAQPWRDHLVGLMPGRPRLPWIAHFSDPWVDSPYYEDVPEAQMAVERRRERDVIQSAHIVVFTNQYAADLVMAKYPRRWSRKVRIVQHAADTDLIPVADNLRSRRPFEPAAPLRLSYVGSLLIGRRTAHALLDALAMLRQRAGIKGLLEMVFVGAGSGTEEARQKVAALGLESVVTFVPHAPHLESLAAMRDSEVLVLIDAPADTNVFFASKLVDYLMAERPILALTSTVGPSADLIRRCGYPLVDPEDARGICDAIQHLLTCHSAGTLAPTAASVALLQEYSVDAAAGAFASVLDEAIANASPIERWVGQLRSALRRVGSRGRRRATNGRSAHGPNWTRAMDHSRAYSLAQWRWRYILAWARYWIYGYALAPTAVRFRRGFARLTYLVVRVKSATVLGVRRVTSFRLSSVRPFGFKDIVRWCWRLIPAPGRYWFYRRAVVGMTLWAGNVPSTGRTAMSYRIARRFWWLLPTAIRHRFYPHLSMSRHPLLVRVFVRGVVLLWRVPSRLLQGARATRSLITLENQRRTALAYWPDARGVDLFTLAAAVAVLSFHPRVLGFVWGHTHLLRKWSGRKREGTAIRKVFHVTSSFDLGGAQTQIMNLCTSRSGSFRHLAIEVFPERNYRFRQDVSVGPAQYVVGGVLRRAAGRLVVNIQTRSLQLVHTYKLVCDMNACRPDIVVGWGHEMSVTGFVAATLARVPHIVFCIRTFNPAYGWVGESLGSLLHRAHSRMTPHVAALITNSTLLQADHARWVGIAPDAITVCPNGIDVAPLTDTEIAERRRSIRAGLGIAEEACVVTNVGRFSAEKGQLSVVSVNERLSRDYPEAQLTWLLCGDGPTLNHVRAQADALGMTNIRFVGRTTTVQEYLCASDIFLMPSDFEGMPNAMMEAMAYGLPCVSTSRSGALDVARDQIEALYYEPGDLKAMERHLRRLIEDRDEARAIGARAQARMREFSVAAFVARFEDVLQKAAPTRTPAAPARVGLEVTRDRKGI
jgi:glycosyltransferase involved in cell wall biosynthesis